MAATLAQLLAPPTVQQIFQVLLATYQANGFPTQSWQALGSERTRLMAMATAIYDFGSNYIPAYTAGGFVDYAPGTGWMPLLALEMYNLPQNLATATVGNITLTSVAGSGGATYAAGQLIAVFAASGNRYINSAPVIVPAGPGSVVGVFTAERVGASYNDASNSGSLSLATPIPGVTPTNPAGNYGTQSHVGAGTGTLTLGGTPVGPHQVVVRIDSTGQSGVASWSYSLDGAAYSTSATTTPLVNIGGVGINITLVNGASNPSFIIGDTYTFNAPGTWITTQGSDLETDTNLATRCRARWSTLSSIGTTQLYQLLATSTPTVGSQVTQVIVQPDANINNKLNIVIAGPGGVLPAGVVTAVQSFIGSRVPITVNPVVLSPTPLNITLAGTITCSASLIVSVQAAVQTAMTNYLAAVPINGTIRLSTITELIMQIAGVIDVSGVTINAAAANLTLGSTTTFIIPSLQPLTFAYVTV